MPVLFLWFAALVWAGIPALIVGKRAGVSLWLWAALPVGDFTTLGRAAGRGRASAVWPAAAVYVLPVVLLAGVLVGVAAVSSGDAAESGVPDAVLALAFAAAFAPSYLIAVVVWSDTCRALGYSARWALLAAIPPFGIPVAWYVSRWPDAVEEPSDGLADASSLPLVIGEESSPSAPSQADALTDGSSAVVSRSAQERHPRAPHRNATNRERPRLQGRSLRVPFWLVSNVAILALVAGFLVADKQTLHWYSPPPPTPTPRPKPDRVVGVLRKCDLPRAPIETHVGKDCVTWQGLAENDRLEVTVRTFSGGSYVVTVPPETKVKVGDRWPK